MMSTACLRALKYYSNLSQPLLFHRTVLRLEHNNYGRVKSFGRKVAYVKKKKKEIKKDLVSSQNIPPCCRACASSSCINTTHHAVVRYKHTREQAQHNSHLF